MSRIPSSSSFTSLNSKQTTHKMWCKINSSNPVLCKFPTKNPKLGPKTITFSSFSNNKKQEFISSTAVTQVQVPESNAYNLKFKTLGGCKLGISRYPDFEYDAEGGIGTGSGTKVRDSELNDEISVSFDIKTLYIPPLTSATTKFLGLPLPPFLKIDIVPEFFQGRIDRESGKVNYATPTNITI
jgi:hypothetical protein